MKKIAKIYTKEGCGACVSAKTFMDNKGIPYEMIEIDKDKDAMNVLRKAGAMSLPFIKIGGVEIIGFNPMAILEAAK